MHVIHAADYRGPYPGSFIPMLAAAAREARARGHSTTILFSEIARGRPWLGELDGLTEIHFVETPSSRLAGVRPAMRDLRSVLRRHPGPVVIHTHFGAFDIPAALTRLLRRDIVVFWHEQTALAETSRAVIRNTLRFGSLGPLVSGLLCVSPEVRDQVAARHAPKRKLHEFLNAIDTSKFGPISDPERRTAREALGVRDATPVVLHFGWDWRRKGGDLMLEAGEIVRQRMDVVTLTVVGEHSGGNLGPAVRALPPRSNVRQLYAAADVFLTCSRAEGTPFAVLEALACGLPVVATDIQIHQQVLAGLPGARVVAAQPGALAGALTELLRLPSDDRRAHAEQAAALIESSYSLTSWAHRLLDLYETTVSNHARRGPRFNSSETPARPDS